MTAQARHPVADPKLDAKEDKEGRHKVEQTPSTVVRLTGAPTHQYQQGGKQKPSNMILEANIVRGTLILGRGILEGKACMPCRQNGECTETGEGATAGAVEKLDECA